MLEVAQFFFRLRAVGQRTGLITSWGAGAFGFMRSLALIGPLTVPQVAKMRPTSRQRMQRLADELAAEGLVEFIDNPRHRRSKLVRLTREGGARYRELGARLRAMASTMGADLSEVDMGRTTKSCGGSAMRRRGARSGCGGVQACRPEAARTTTQRPQGEAAAAVPEAPRWRPVRFSHDTVM